MVVTKIGNRAYPIRSEPRCRVCNSPHRQWIEAQLVRGMSYRSIAHEVEGMPNGSAKVPSRESIGAHFRNGHMPLGQDVQRQIIERRAREIGRDVENGDGTSLADHVTVAQMIVQRGVEQVADGTMPLSASDVLKASAFLRQVEASTQGADDAEIWAEAMAVYMGIAQQFIPADKHRAYARALHASPLLRALASRQSRDVEVGEVVQPDNESQEDQDEPQEDEQDEQGASVRNTSTPPPEDW